MQNIDYSKRFASVRQEPKQSRRTNTKLVPGSGFILVIGATFIFTAGVLVGLKLEQKEDKFAQNEKITVRNYGNEAVKSLEKTTPVKREHNLTILSSVPTGIKYPPKSKAINYLIQVASADTAEADGLGKNIIKKNYNLQGRIFKTSTGKLYIGYYYDKKEAQKMIETIKNQGFMNLELKTIRFE